MPHQKIRLVVSLWLLAAVMDAPTLSGESLWGQSLPAAQGAAFRGLTPPPPGQIGGRITVSVAPVTELSAPEGDPGTGGGVHALPRPEAATGPPPEGDQGQLLRRIAGHYSDIILRKVQGTRVPPGLVIGLIAVESGGRHAATSARGAAGLMQLMPATAAAFGVKDPKDPASNIGGGIAYLDHLLEQFGGDIELALAGYNAGPAAVRRHKGVPPFAETRRFVPEVLAAWQLARRLCLAPADLPQEACPAAQPTLR